MNKLLGNRKKGLTFVVSAPAGTGKTTLVQMLVEEFPSVVRSISYTTRKCRPGEVPGIDYHYVSKEEFERKIANNELLEWAELYGNYYGTEYKSLQDLLDQGKHVILVIDTQGAMKLKGKFPAIFIFLEPPSFDALRERLTQRQTENFNVIEERLQWATKELELVREYDYQIINDELTTAYQVLRSILIAEDHRVN